MPDRFDPAPRTVRVVYREARPEERDLLRRGFSPGPRPPMAYDPSRAAQPASPVVPGTPEEEPPAR